MKRKSLVAGFRGRVPLNQIIAVRQPRIPKHTIRMPGRALRKFAIKVKPWITILVKV